MKPVHCWADVEARDLLDPERALHEHAGPREEVVRRQGRVDDQVDVLRIDLRALHRLGARGRRERATGLALLDPVTLLDAGPLHDPLVRRLHLGGELVVGDDAPGHRHTDARIRLRWVMRVGYHVASHEIERETALRVTRRVT